jgi:hypothetical protein
VPDRPETKSFQRAEKLTEENLTGHVSCLLIASWDHHSRYQDTTYRIFMILAPSRSFEVLGASTSSTPGISRYQRLGLMVVEGTPIEKAMVWYETPPRERVILD